MKVNKFLLSDNISMHGGEQPHKKREANYSGNIINNINKVGNDEYRPAERVSSGGSERLSGNISFAGGKEKVIRTTADMIKDASIEAIHKGSVEIPKWADKMGGANWFGGVLKSVDKNETFYEAVTALVVAGMLKPVCVLAMPGAEMEDKQMSATKNSVSAFLGFGLSNLILSPFSEGVNKVMKSLDSKNPTKYIKDRSYVDVLNNEELVKLADGTQLKSTLKDSFKTTYKKLPDLGVSPMKAALTIAITPYILKLLFGKDKKGKGKKKNPVDNPMSKMTVMNAIRMENNRKAENSSAPSFTGNKNQNKNSVSFKGAALTKAADTAKEAAGAIAENVPKKSFLKNAKDAYNNFLGEPIARLIGRFAPTKAGQKLVETTARFEKPAARWSDLASFAITYFYVSNTAKSDKIEEDRKLPLMINNVMVTAASSTAAFLIDKYTDKPMEELLKSYLKHHDDNVHESARKNIVKTLDTALKNGKDEVDLDALKKHSDSLLSGGLDNITDGLKNSIKDLQDNETVQRAIKEKIIESDDVAKMAASGFEKQANNIYKNISKAKSLTVFTLTVRFLVTVLMTPVIGRVVALVNKKLGKDKESQNKQSAPYVPAPGSETFGMKDFMSGLKS